MDESLLLNGEKFISSKRAAEITGYTQDYIGQLARESKVDARRIGRSWYVSEKSLVRHEESHHGSYEEDDEETGNSHPDTAEKTEKPAKKEGSDSVSGSASGSTETSEAPSKIGIVEKAQSVSGKETEADSSGSNSKKSDGPENSDTREVEIGAEETEEMQKGEQNLGSPSFDSDAKDDTKSAAKKSTPDSVLEAAGGMYSYHGYSDPGKTEESRVDEASSQGMPEEHEEEVVPVEHARPADAALDVPIHRASKSKNTPAKQTHRVVRRETMQPYAEDEAGEATATDTSPRKQRGKAVLVGVIVIIGIAFIGTLAGGFLVTQEVAYSSANEVERTTFTLSDVGMAEIKGYIKEIVGKLR